MNQTATQPKSRKSQNLLLMTGLLMISLAFVAVTFFLLARDAMHEQAWVRMATDIQVSSQQLSKSAGEAASIKLEAFEELSASHDRMSHAMQVLGSGSKAEGARALAGDVREPYDQLAMTWRRVSANADRIRQREGLVRALSEASNAFSAATPAIQKEAEDMVSALTQSGAPLAQVAAAGRQPVHAERMLRRVSEILGGGSNAVNAAKALELEVSDFEQTLSALQGGSNSLGIEAVRNARALSALNRMRSGFDEAREQLQTILDSATALFEIRGAADEIFLDARLVFNKAGNLAAAIVDLPHTRIWPSILSGVTGLLILFVIVALLVRSVVFAERERASVATSRDRKNQQAIKRLLDELGSLAKGDLTVQASVSEEVTRDIATAVNYAVQRLREIVAGINETSHAVAQSAETTRSSAASLAKAASEQAEQMDSATDDVRNIANAFDSMAKRSRDSSEVAHKSVEIAHSGAQKVRQTIAGMDLIREQIQETSKRIKRLGESSQEIGDIIGLINGIAEQTNVLALNAAIQAASAGGAGKGFAMVADEVQELAESATQATRRIESLVQTIQADTSEAVHSMESTTTEVVRGANQAEDAGAALEKIETVSNDLSSMIQEISAEAQAQSAAATRISELMHGVRDVSVKNSTGSKATAETVDTLADLVLQLSESVSDFKVPGTRSEQEDPDG